MSLTDAIAEATGTTPRDIFDEVAARTVNVQGILPGAELQGVIVAAWLMPLVKDTAEDTTETDRLFRGICIGLNDRFGPDGEIDFGNPENVGLLDAFLDDTRVTGILAEQGNPFQTDEAFKAAVLAKATKPQLEFPGLTLRDVHVAITPGLDGKSISNPVGVNADGQTYRLTVTDDIHDPEGFKVYISMMGAMWVETPVIWLDEIAGAGTYDFQLELPSGLALINTSLMVRSTYATAISLTAV